MLRPSTCVYPVRNFNQPPIVVSQPRGTDVLIDALTWGTKWASATNGPLVIPVTIYNPSSDTAGAYKPTAQEIAAVQAVLNTYKQYINVQFIFNESPTASGQGINFVIGKNGGAGTLGFSNPPGSTSYLGVSYSNVFIYRDAYRSGSGFDLTKGGADFATYLHEFGHALGLAHPHDNGGAIGSPSSIFPDVTRALGSMGLFDLNQGINSIMGYNDGWQKAPHGYSTSVLYGYQSGPMALDILALQNMYGPNLSYHLGDDSFTLPGTNAVGTGYSCIWDAGGNDTITGAATLSNVIDLRAATGQVGVGGGGFVSYAAGIHGGFTIAAGVIIENAVGGIFADKIIGNAYDNHITGGGGADTLTGGAGHDVFIYSSVVDSGTAQIDSITDFVDGTDTLDFSLINANSLLANDQSFALIGSAAFTGAGQIRVVDNGTDTFVYANINSDLAPDFCLKLLGHHVLTSGDFIL
jgi:serralysin